MSHSVRDILKKAQRDGASKKGRFTLWISDWVVADFKEALGDMVPSRVIERFMIEVIKDSKKEKDGDE